MRVTATHGSTAHVVCNSEQIVLYFCCWQVLQQSAICRRSHLLYAKLPNLVEQRKIRAIMTFKVIQGHRFWYQSKAHMRLPISD